MIFVTHSTSWKEYKITIDEVWFTTQIAPSPSISLYRITFPGPKGPASVGNKN